MAGEVLAMGDQALVQLAGEHRDAVDPGVVPKPVAGHADPGACSSVGAPFRGGTPPQRLTMGPVQKNQTTPGRPGRHSIANKKRPSTEH